MPDATSAPRKRGAQPDNTNSLKHGKYATNLYERSMSRSDRRTLAIARLMSIANLQEEAATIRTQIAKLIGDPENPGKDGLTPKDLPVFAEMMRTLCRVAATHYNLNKQQAEDLEDAMFTVFDDIRKTMGE